MSELFVRPDGSPMQFHLAELNETQETKYTLLIEDNGGKVEADGDENILSFTVPDKSLNYEFVFDVKFLDDCVEQKKIMNINSYYLGDKRHNKGCLLSKAFMKSSQCMCASMVYKDVFKAFQNQIKMRDATLKSTESQNKQTKKKNVPSKKNVMVELDIEKSSKEKKTTVEKTVSDKNTLQDIQHKTNIIEESDSETEIARSPVLNKTGEAKNPKRKILHQEIAELSKPSTSEEKSSQDSVIILSSDDEADKNKTDENSIRKGKNAEDSEETADTNMPIARKIQMLIHETLKNKRLDRNGYPESSNFQSEKFDLSETQTMLRYLIITDRVSEAKNLPVWKDLQKLKLLPRKKGSQRMLNYFKSRVLPNIDSFDLTPEELEKFNVLGPKKVMDNS